MIPRWAQNLNKDTYQTFDINLVSTGTAWSWCLSGNFLAHIFPFPDWIMGNTKELLSLYLIFQKEKKICYSDFHKLSQRPFVKYSGSRKFGKCARAVFIVEPVFAKVAFFATPICASGIASFILFTYYKINIRVTISLHCSFFYFVKRCSAKVLSMWIPLDRSILNIIIEKSHPYKNEIIYVKPLLVTDDCYIKSNNHWTGFIKKRGKIYRNTVCRKNLSFHNTIHFQNDFCETIISGWAVPQNELCRHIFNLNLKRISTFKTIKKSKKLDNVPIWDNNNNNKKSISISRYAYSDSLGIIDWAMEKERSQNPYL